MQNIAHYHLPGLFEFYDLYRVFLPLYRQHRNWFYDWCDIVSIYGAPENCLWGGGRISCGNESPIKVLSLLKEYDISAHLTFSNSLLTEVHLSDMQCNHLCSLFSENKELHNGVIVHSELLLNYLLEAYPDLCLISSTTKGLSEFEAFRKEVQRECFSYVVPDFHLNNAYAKLTSLSIHEKMKVEFLCNECCPLECPDRKGCYENISHRALGESIDEHICCSPNAASGYQFSAAMKHPSFIGISDIRKWYLPNGFSHFKIEGRNLGSAVILEMLLYYLAKPEYQLEIRENIYLSNNLDLF